jgi:hypothetical protein
MEKAAASRRTPRYAEKYAVRRRPLRPSAAYLATWKETAEMHHVTTHRFQIRVNGWLADHWSEGFEGMTLRRLEDGDTVLEGEAPDQSALFGVLHAIETLGLAVVCVRTFPNGEALC